MNLLDIKMKISSGTSIYDIPLRVTYYARVSTDKDAQINSLDNQIFYYNNKIKNQLNWDYVEGYVDEGISGKSVKNRTSFLTMINDAKADKFDLILTKEISRFSRNTLDSIMYTQQLLSYGVGVLFESDNINTLDADSELRLTIMASIAQEEVRKLSERLRFGYKRSIEKGRILGQNNMLGYDKKDGKLTIIEEEAAIVERIFNIYNEGKLGVRSIARQLEKEGTVSPNSGKMYTYGSIINILTNPKYKGYYCARKTVSVDFKNSKNIRMPKDEWIIYKDENIPAIVSEEVWDKANRLYEERSEKVKNKSQCTQNRYTFSGKIICAEHGTSFHRHIYTSKKNGSQEVWNCKMYRLKGRLDGCDSPTIYSRELNEILNEIYQTIYEQKDTVIDGLINLYGIIDEKDYSKDIENAQKEIASLEAKKDKLLELLMDGIISKEELKSRNDKMNSDIQTHLKVIDLTNTVKENSLKSKQNLLSVKKVLQQEISNSDNFVSELSTVLLDKIIVHKIDNDKHHVRLEIFLNIGKSYVAEYSKNGCISLQEIGISQAQVSRLEKSALSRIKKQI